MSSTSMSTRMYVAANKLSRFPSEAMQRLEAQLLSKDNTVLNTVASGRTMMFVLFAVVCYVSVVGTVISSDVRSVVPALFGVLTMMLPLAVGVVLIALHVLVLHRVNCDASKYRIDTGNGYSPAVVTRSRGLVIIGVAYVIWGLGDVFFLGAGPHVTLVFHDIAIALIVIGYSELPSPSNCMKVKAVIQQLSSDAARSYTQESSEPGSLGRSEDKTTEATRDLLKEQAQTYTATWNTLIASKRIDTYVSTFVIKAYAALSTVLLVLLPLVVPWNKLSVLLCTLHAVIGVGAFVLVGRTQPSMPFMLVLSGGVLSNCVTVVSLMIASYGIHIMEVVGWLANMQAVTLIMAPALIIGKILSGYNPNTEI